VPPDTRVHCGVAVFIQRHVFDDHVGHSEVLLVHRAGSGEYASDGAGKWAMPGGWLDFGESFAKTGERETLEETGVVVRCDDRPLDTVSVMAENGEFQIVVPIVRGTYVSGAASVQEPDKHSDVRWGPFGGGAKVPLFGSTAAYFESVGFEVDA